MKEFLKKPVVMLLLGLVAGWAITRLAFVKKWPIISTAVTAEENCDECYNPPDGKIPGASAMSATEAQVGIHAFAALTQQLKNQAKDSAGNYLWNISNNGGYIPKDLMRTLLGRMSSKEDKIGFYYGIQPGTNLLSIYFGTGTADCPVPDAGVEIGNFGDFDVIVVPIDSSTSCPPNCPDFGNPTDLPFPSPGPLPKPAPPDSANN